MSKRNNIFFTADWHIGHKNSLTLDGRPFKDIDDMSRGLVRRFNATVPIGGTTYFLGDMGLCKGDIIKGVVDQLNGTKILILGNHDKGPRAMSRLGFDIVLNMASIWIGGEVVTMTHCPLLGVRREDTEGMRGSDGTENWHGEKRHTKFSIPSWGQFHLHGHIHSPNGEKSIKILGRQYDVGLPANKYSPVSISNIESWIARTKIDEESVNGG